VILSTNPATDHAMKISDGIAGEIQKFLQQDDPNSFEPHENVFPIFQAFYQLQEGP
jgi:hypothetical protein